jgi:tol-pal system protein YbgF
MYKPKRRHSSLQTGGRTESSGISGWIPGEAAFRVLSVAAVLSAGMLLPGCGVFQGSSVVRQPEFQELSGRVTNLEDIVVGRRAEGLPPGNLDTPPPGAGAYAPPPQPASRGSERSRYNRALGLVRAKRYAEAADAFRSFLTDFPAGRLSPNARYWLGETHYARGDFAGALAEFQRGVRDYPESPKAPDCLLKAAYSQSKLGDGPGAMESMRYLLERYPGSPSAGLVRSGSSRFPK